MDRVIHDIFFSDVPLDVVTIALVLLLLRAAWYYGWSRE